MKARINRSVHCPECNGVMLIKEPPGYPAVMECRGLKEGMKPCPLNGKLFKTPTIEIEEDDKAYHCVQPGCHRIMFPEEVWFCQSCGAPVCPDHTVDVVMKQVCSVCNEKKRRQLLRLSCLCCDWTGPKTEAHWHDMSHFDDDSMCSNQEGSGLWECPSCGEACREIE